MLMKICTTKKESEWVGKVPRTPCGLGPTSEPRSHQSSRVPTVSWVPPLTRSHQHHQLVHTVIDCNAICLLCIDCSNLSSYLKILLALYTSVQFTQCNAHHVHSTMRNVWCTLDICLWASPKQLEAATFFSAKLEGGQPTQAHGS